jgi:electron transfer flavoprotein beta subunit
MIGVCLKWVDQRPELDALGAPTAPDARFAGVSAADQAALEWALRCRDALAPSINHDVVVITVGPPEADAVLRDALTVGAARAVRIDLPFGTPSRVVAASIAVQFADATLVWCGDYSIDRGTGSVPAFLADELNCGQALGLVDVDLQSPAGITALRRLDGGRRERVAIEAHTVASVEGSTAMLRRAPLRALLGAHHIEVIAGPTPGLTETPPVLTRPYRPRPRMLAAPVGATALDRVHSITATDAHVSHGETVVLEPAAAAERIIATLRDWGYPTQ